MLTKKQACMAVIEEFKLQENVDSVVESDILKSSKLAVAMEYMGAIINPDLMAYAANRGGHVLNWYDEEGRRAHSLSFRELLELLPE